MRRHRRKVEDTTVRVLCVQCSEWFQTPRSCMECSNWNVCLSCLKQEGEKIEAELAARGIVLPGRK